ncbi:bifunctional GrpB family protein/GNAT family N-acetyltransferase [Candidatus Odyssella thessalonicensis]|uniref:bifunctional GrpB family protein/GNAT family N-acetyltransferase n=1 Tax=Candidatus Odyssella thessalonicensis TaxID=84647 RepID=UPI0003132580|nr:bifunctional GrpB family protein/GNAT family N-acetyltransferase [Candidatus Odyssella thessalonicensis]
MESSSLVSQLKALVTTWIVAIKTGNDSLLLICSDNGKELIAMKQDKIIKVVPYNAEWPALAEIETARLKEILGPACIETHHIGSTSVPGLAAKEDLDILCVVDKLESSLTLKDIGYAFKGEFNIPLRYFFSKNTDTCKVNLHVTEREHGFISLNLCFRDYLRSHEDCRSDYQKLKYQLLQDPTSFERINGRFPKYTLEKNHFIKDILNQAGYSGINFNFCIHTAEWEAAKHYRQSYFFNSASVDDPYTWTFNHPNHIHLVMYMGIRIIGYAHLQLWPDRCAVLHILTIHKTQRNKGQGKRFLHLLEKWLKNKQFKSLHIESPVEVLPFYKKYGYTSVPFNDSDEYKIKAGVTPLGKFL